MKGDARYCESAGDEMRRLQEIGMQNMETVQRMLDDRSIAERASHPLYSFLARNDVAVPINTDSLKTTIPQPDSRYSERDFEAAQYSDLAEFAKAIMIAERELGFTWTLFFEYGGIAMGVLSHPDSDIHMAFWIFPNQPYASIAIVSGEYTFETLYADVTAIREMIND